MISFIQIDRVYPYNAILIKTKEMNLWKNLQHSC